MASNWSISLSGTQTPRPPEFRLAGIERKKISYRVIRGDSEWNYFLFHTLFPEPIDSGYRRDRIRYWTLLIQSIYCLPEYAASAATKFVLNSVFSRSLYLFLSGQMLQDGGELHKVGNRAMHFFFCLTK